MEQAGGWVGGWVGGRAYHVGGDGLEVVVDPFLGEVGGGLDALPQGRFGCLGRGLDVLFCQNVVDEEGEVVAHSGTPGGWGSGWVGG